MTGIWGLTEAENGGRQTRLVGVIPPDQVRRTTAMPHRSSNLPFTNQCPTEQRESHSHLTVQVQLGHLRVDQDFAEDQW